MRPIHCTRTLSAGLLTIALSAIGCSSSSPDSGEINSGPALGGSTTTGGTTEMQGPGPTMPTTTIPNDPLTIAPSEEAEDTDCASQETPTAFRQVALAFVFDVSASMGSGDENQPQYSKELKWDPVVAATKEFFADPASEGLLATMTFFPNELATLTGEGFGTNGGPSCDAANYSETDVPLTPLPSDAFSLAIDAITPPDLDSWRLGTPTLAAVDGTIQAIQAMQATNPNTQFAIVMVTDGFPALCFGGGNDSVTDVATAVQAVATDIPTYVIGVQTPGEESLDQLNEVAVAGGTNAAFLVDTADPVQTKTDLLGVIEEIRESTFTCNIDIPPPPGGQAFDKSKVNVTFATDVAGEMPFTYDPTCAAPNSWRYDNADNPTVIEVCPGSCESIKATVENGQLNVEFGCKTRVK